MEVALREAFALFFRDTRKMIYGSDDYDKSGFPKAGRYFIDFIQRSSGS